MRWFLLCCAAQILTSSVDISDIIPDAHGTLAFHVPFLYAIFYGASTMHGYSDLEITHQMLHTVFEYPPDQIGFTVMRIVPYVICWHDLAIAVWAIK
jgi:hypothetical protein